MPIAESQRGRIAVRRKSQKKIPEPIAKQVAPIA